MTQKERLVELLKRIDREYEQHFYFQNTREYYPDEEDFEYFAKKLLANGVILPPCKVGDTVYCAALRSIAPFIKQETVERIQYTEQGFYYGMQKGIYFEDEVFFAREEAEQALRERETNESTS